MEVKPPVPQVPPPVWAYCVETVTWLGVGLMLMGTCGPPPAIGSRPWFITLGSRRDATDATRAALVAHETAHAWLMAEPPLGATQAAAAVAAARRADDRDERLARALTTAWGFENV